MPDTTDAIPTPLTDCNVETDTSKFSVQASPPLVIQTDKVTGEEVHHSGDAAVSAWNEIKHLFEAAEDAGETGLKKAATTLRKAAADLRSMAKPAAAPVKGPVVPDVDPPAA